MTRSELESSSPARISYLSPASRRTTMLFASGHLSRAVGDLGNLSRKGDVKRCGSEFGEERVLGVARGSSYPCLCLRQVVVSWCADIGGSRLTRLRDNKRA